MGPKLLTACAAGALFATSQPAPAQWLNPTLDAQRWDNLRKHQQRQRERAQQKHRQGPQSRITRAERQAAWSRNKAEYRRRMLRDGPASADRWLDGLVRAGRR